MPAETRGDDPATPLRLLLDLVRTALELPDVEGGDDEPVRLDHAAWKQMHASFATLRGPQFYATADAYEIGGEELVGDLHDDLADVWRDLRPSLDLFEAGHHEAAAWHWAFTFRYHWGEHAVEAIRVLRAAMFEDPPEG